MSEQLRQLLHNSQAQTQSLDALVRALQRLPGVGVKSASRMAFHLLQHDREGAEMISQALHQAAAQVQHCERCHTFTTQPVCDTCLDEGRDTTRPFLIIAGGEPLRSFDDLVQALLHVQTLIPA